jgi:hypothetical protein
MTTSISLCHSCALLDRSRGRACAAFPAGIPSAYIDEGEAHTASLTGEPVYELDETFAGSLEAWKVMTGRSLGGAKHYGPGLHPGTKTPQAVHSRAVGGRQDGSTFRIDRFEPVSFLAKLLPDSDFDFHDVRADRAQGERVRDAYEALPAYDEDAVPAFLAMGKQVDDQFETLTKRLGVRVTFTDDEPYEDVMGLIADLRDNKHIAVLRTSATGGHPIFSNEQNDRFRAVHDAFGHGGTGRGFDRHGEEAAWAAHSRMFTGDARLAMTTETRGQNSTMVWGKGEFPEQKVALLPEFAYEAVSTSETKSADDDNLFHLSGVHHAALGRWGLEAKHAGPGPHSTGTPQAMHGGGVGGNPFTAGLYAGLYEMKSIAALADEAEAIFTSVLASGELSTKPNTDRPDEATPYATVEAARGMLGDLRVAAGREAAEAPIGQIMGGGSSVFWLPRLTDLHGVAKDMEAKTFRNPLFLRALTASAERAKEDAKEARLRSGKTSDRFPSPLSDTYTATAKSEVQQQVTDGWAARGWDPDDAGELHRGVGRGDSYLQSGETDEVHAGRLAAIAIQTWAATSNDSDRFSLAVQEAAVKEFGLDGHQGWDTAAPVLSDSASEVAQGTLRDMHDRTQAWFAERDITEVSLYRGQNEYASVDDTFDPIDLEFGHEAPEDTLIRATEVGIGDGTVRLRPLSSWSADRRTAYGFTTYSGSVMHATVPVSRILSHPRTGFGCLSEEECVVLGGTMGITWNRRE